MRLHEGETIVAAWAEKCSGPGWQNRVVWVLVRTANKASLRIEAIQPQEQTRVLSALFDTSAALTREMLAEINAMRCER